MSRKEAMQGMDIVEAINRRRSIRAFKSDPVSRETVTEIMELALRAPSWGNTQPWEFAVVTGRKLEEIRQAVMKKAAAAEEVSSDIPRPREFPQPYDTRYRTLGKSVLELKGIGREDKEKRRHWVLQGMRSFEAPCVIYIYFDRSLYQQGDGVNIWPLFDCGLVAENIMLLATAHGLGTIAQIQAVLYPEVLRKALGITDSKVIVLGIAVGYPDWDDPVNRFRSEREPLENVSAWHGFE
jgi:nitroreductase